MNFKDFTKQLNIRMQNFPFEVTNENSAYFWISKVGSVIGAEICHYEFIAVNKDGEVDDNACNNNYEYKINLEIHFEFGKSNGCICAFEIFKLHKLLGNKIQYRFNSAKNQVGIVFASFDSADKKLIKKAIKALNKMDKKFTKYLENVFLMKKYKKNCCVSLEKVFFVVLISALIAVMTTYLFLEKDVFSNSKFNFSLLCYSCLAIVSIISFTIICIALNNSKLKLKKLNELSKPIDSIVIQDFDGDTKLSENISTVTNGQTLNNHPIEYYPVNKASVDLFKAYAATIENI